MTRTLDTPVLERMLEPVTRSLNVDAAKKLVRLKADAKIQARVAKLARKCNEGELTPEEAAEYDRYIAYAMSSRFCRPRRGFSSPRNPDETCHATSGAAPS